MTAGIFFKVAQNDTRFRREIYLYLALLSFCVAVMIALIVYLAAELSDASLAENRMEQLSQLKQQYAAEKTKYDYNLANYGEPLSEDKIDKIQNVFLGSMEEKFSLKLQKLERDDGREGNDSLPSYEYKVVVTGKWKDIMTACAHMDREKMDGKRLLVEFKSMEMEVSDLPEILKASMTYMIYTDVQGGADEKSNK